MHEGEVAVVTDFDPREDDLRLSVQSFEPKPVLVEVNGDTQVHIDGQPVAVIKGQTDLSVGYRTVSDDGVINLTDADGNNIDRSDKVDMVIELINPPNFYL